MTQLPTNHKEHHMNAIAHKMTPDFTPTVAEKPLQSWYLAVDGNEHRQDLQAEIPTTGEFLLCEAMLPQVRMMACWIAAERHDFSERSPKTFTEEADWFAARILVLGARVFHLDVTLIPMLDIANSRAKAFAQKHGLAFAPARIQMSLHAARPHGGLMIENECLAEQDLGMVGNSIWLKAQLPAIAID